nr:nephrocystin-3 [Quercus suber]
MSGAEAIAAIGLIDACIGITKTIIDIGRAVHDAQGLPSKLRALFEQLPAIEDLLETAQERCEKGDVPRDSGKSAEPILQQCQQALGELRDIFRKACPKDGEDRSKRIWRGAKTVFFGRDSQLQRLLETIQSNLTLLEQKELYSIRDKLDELHEVAESLAQDDGSKYAHSGAGNIIANEGGSPTNYVQGGNNNRQINNPAAYYEGSKTARVTARPIIQRSVSTRSGVCRADNVKEPVALEAVHLCRQSGAGRIWWSGAPKTWVLWIHASNVARFDQSVRDVADQLRLHGRQSPKADLLQLLHNWLRDERKGRWLVVLDNADDASFLLQRPIAVDGAQLARRRIDYVPACDHGSMIITTRNKSEALKLVYESETIDVLPMSDEEAVTLLAKKLGKLGSQAEQRQLVTALDRIPLAIIHAAAYIRLRTPQRSVQQYCEEVEQSRTSRTSLLKQDFEHPGRDADARNSVLLTWQISFEDIYRTRRSAADLLSLMSFCDRLAIPESLLRANIKGTEALSSRQDFEKDVVTLRSFSFISATTSTQIWEMHRLVQDATQMWLDDHRRLDEFHSHFVHRLYRSLPAGTFENWPSCRELFPHAKCAGEQKPVGGKAQLEWASVMYNSAWYACEQGSFLDTLTMARSSLEVRMKQLGDKDPLTLWSIAMIADGHRTGGQWKEAEELEVKVMETRRTVLGAEHPDTLTGMGNLASTYRNQGRWKEAEELSVKVMVTRRTVLGAEHPSTLTGMANLALTYQNQGRWKEAEELEVKVMETSRTVLGAEHTDTLTSMGNLASTYQSQGRWKEAEELEVKVMETRRTVLGAEHPDTLTSMANLASTYRNQGRWKGAEELFMKVMETRSTVLGAEHPSTLTSMGNLASTYWSLGRWKEAEELFVKVMETRRTVLGREHPDTLTSMNNLALIYSDQERWAEAETLQNQAVGGFKKSYGPKHPHTLTALQTLAYVQHMRQQEPLKNTVQQEPLHSQQQSPEQHGRSRNEVGRHSIEIEKEVPEQNQGKSRWTGQAGAGAETRAQIYARLRIHANYEWENKQSIEDALVAYGGVLVAVSLGRPALLMVFLFHAMRREGKLYGFLKGHPRLGGARPNCDQPSAFCADMGLLRRSRPCF